MSEETQPVEKIVSDKLEAGEAPLGALTERETQPVEEPVKESVEEPAPKKRKPAPKKEKPEPRTKAERSLYQLR